MSTTTTARRISIVTCVVLTILAALLVPCGQAVAADYHVALTGDNTTGDGSLGDPWRTIQYGSNQLSPGDTLHVHAGKYPDSGDSQSRIEPHNSGTSGNWVTIRNYQNDYVTIATTEQCFYVEDVEYVIIDGFELVGAGSPPTIVSYADNIIIRNCIVRQASNAVKSNSTSTRHSGLLIENCYMHWFTDIPIFVDNMDDVIIRNNTVIKSSTVLMDPGGVTNLLVEDNFAYNNYSSLGELKIRWGNVEPQQDDNCNGAIVRGNVFLNGEKYMMLLSSANGAMVYNNVFGKIDGLATTSGVIYMQQDGTDAIDNKNENNVIKNNILYHTGADSKLLYMQDSMSEDYDDQQIDYNCYFKDTGTLYLGYGATSVYENGVVGWRSLYDYNSLVGDDPNMYDPTVAAGYEGFELTVGSPCIDAGTVLTRTNGSGSGTTITVDDARYFCGGLGLIDGDAILVDDTTATVVSRNISSNTITVDRSISWSDNDPVSLEYAGAAPDIGAIETDYDPNNTAPAVNAGDNGTVTLPENATLDGTISDDGVPVSPGVVSTTWSVVSASGSVVFNDASAVDTTVQLSGEGTYVLRLTADDGNKKTSDDVTIIASDGGTAYFHEDFNDDELSSNPTWTVLAGSFDTFQFLSEPGYEVHGLNTGSRMRAWLDDTNLPDVVNLTWDVRHTGGAQGQGGTGAKTGWMWFLNSSGDGLGLKIQLSQFGPGALVLVSTTDSGFSEASTLGTYSAPPAAMGNDLKALELVYNRTSGDIECFYEGDSMGTVNVSSSYEDFTRVYLGLHNAYDGYWGQLDVDNIWAYEGDAGTGNQSPTADAGSDDSCTIPNSVSLDGTISDDGLPETPGTVTTTWSKVSGAGTVTFGNASAVDTTAGFSDSGVYVLRLTASDGDLSDTDDVTITVNHLAPTADAGSDDECTLPSDVTLDGTISDDGFPLTPGAVTTTWAKQSGPGTVTFGNSAAVDTTAGFSESGAYVLRLTAGDGDKTDYDDVTITVNSQQQNASPTVNAGDDGTASLSNAIATESFSDMTLDSAVAGQSGSSTGWTGNWYYRDYPSDPNRQLLGAVVVDPDTNLTYDKGGISIDGGNAALQVTCDTLGAATYDKSVTRALADSFSGSDLYLRYLIRWSDEEGGTWYANEVLGLYLIGTPSSGNRFAACARYDTEDFYIATWTTLDYYYNWDADSNTMAATHMVVAHMYDKDPNGYYWSYDLWVDPNSNEGGTPHATAEITSVGTDRPLQTADYLYIFEGMHLDPNDQFYVDEIVLGATWSDVIADAEPAASLDGTVSDDGLPDPPASLTTTWSKVSGPGTVTFNDAGAVDTSVTFSESGTYVLQLEGSDGSLSDSDTVQITVGDEGTSNTAPTADAGSNDSCTIPNSVSLDGTISDDGLPDPPASVTTTWSKVSGPGTVTFGNSAAVDTTAGFSENGVYVLRLTAHDAALSDTDDVTITVNHLAPTADAGSNDSITLPSNATLDGTVSDDGYPLSPGAVTTAWTKVSGPGTVTFGNSAAVDTTAGFSEDGVYVLRLTADDGDKTDYDDVTITVNHLAPTADAGSNDSITLPSNATLDGTVSDDGFPLDPGTVTAAWTKVSGPGTVTFGNSAAVDTTAGFSEDGVYVLRLTADDGDKTDYDDVTITVDHLAPTADAGSDDECTLPAGVTLDGTVSDDGFPLDPGTVTAAWTKVSGPGTVTFGNSAAVDTTADFSETGAYVLRLTADDGDKTDYDDVTITVSSSNAAPTVDAGADDDVTLSNVIAMEPFSGMTLDSAVASQSGSGTGWTGDWYYRSYPSDPNRQLLGAVVVDPDTNLTYDKGGITIDGGDAALQVTCDTLGASTYDKTVTRALADSFSGSDLYLRYLIRWSDEEGGTWYANELLGLYLTGTPSSGNKFQAAALYGTDDFFIGTWTRLDYYYDWDADSNTMAATHMVVAHMYDQDPNGYYWSYDLWVDPNSDEGGSPHATGEITSVGTDRPLLTADYLYIHEGAHLDPNDQFYMDEIVLGTTWSDVIEVSDSASLDGTVSDDGMPSPPASLTTTWSKVSGPGIVTFDDVNVVDTAVSFSESGVYVLELEGSDGNMSDSDTVQVTVTTE